MGRAARKQQHRDPLNTFHSAKRFIVRLPGFGVFHVQGGQQRRLGCFASRRRCMLCVLQSCIRARRHDALGSHLSGRRQ